MNSLAKHFYLEYERALELFETDRQSALKLLTGLTLEPHLTLWYRVQVHSCLAYELDHLNSAHEHLAAADRAYAEIVRRWPPGTPGQEAMHITLADFRTDMDTRRRELVEEEREASLQGTEGAESSRKFDTERPATPRQAAEESGAGGLPQSPATALSMDQLTISSTPVAHEKSPLTPTQSQVPVEPTTPSRRRKEREEPGTPTKTGR